MRVGLAIAVLLALAGCSFGERKAAQDDATVSSRVERCTERVLDRIGGGAEIRRYVERTYCEPFALKGWVYADGTMSIKAHVYVLNGYACSATTGTSDGHMTPIPCDPRPLHPLECALLHYVRRDEVRAYIRKLQRSQRVTCDDGTPLDKLGAE